MVRKGVDAPLRRYFTPAETISLSIFRETTQPSVSVTKNQHVVTLAMLFNDRLAGVEVRRISVDAAWQNVIDRPKRPPPAPPAAAPPPPPITAPLAKNAADVFSFYQQQRPLLPASLQPAEKEKLLGQLWRALSDADRAKYNKIDEPRVPANLECQRTLFCNMQRPLLPPGLRNAEREQLLGQMWEALVKHGQRTGAPSNRWAVCRGATSSLPSSTPARVPTGQVAEWASMGGPWDSSGARMAAYSARATRSAVPEFIQRSAKAAEAAYRAYYSATGGGGMHAGRVPMPLSRKVPSTAGPPALMSEPVQPDTPAPLLATIVAPPIKRPAPPAPSAPKTHGLYTDSDLRAALLALRQPCAPQQEARATLAAKKRPRERPLDPLEDERVAVWNRVTGNKLTGQVDLTVELALAPTLTLTPPPPSRLYLAK